MSRSSSTPGAINATFGSKKPTKHARVESKMSNKQDMPPTSSERI
jgi:hypothetical protein